MSKGKSIIMKKFQIFTDLLIFEIKYSHGFLYFDRCGQTILDIETQCDGWFCARTEKNTGQLENPEKRMVLDFSDNSFTFSIKPEKLDEDLIAKEVQKLWKIIKANFGLEEYYRIRCRIYFLKPTHSSDESEKFIKSSKFNVYVPDNLKSPNYNLNIRQVIAIFEKEGVEYRVELKGITRAESVDPSGLLGRPETMSKDQQKYRQLKMKRLAEYSANPMYAVMLDIDCAKYNPEQFSVGDYIKNQLDIVRKDFLPILENL